MTFGPMFLTGEFIKRHFKKAHDNRPNRIVSALPSILTSFNGGEPPNKETLAAINALAKRIMDPVYSSREIMSGKGEIASQINRHIAITNLAQPHSRQNEVLEWEFNWHFDFESKMPVFQQPIFNHDVASILKVIRSLLIDYYGARANANDPNVEQPQELYQVAFNLFKNTSAIKVVDENDKNYFKFFRAVEFNDLECLALCLRVAHHRENFGSIAGGYNSYQVCIIYADNLLKFYVRHPIEGDFIDTEAAVASSEFAQALCGCLTTLAEDVRHPDDVAYYVSDDHGEAVCELAHCAHDDIPLGCSVGYPNSHMTHALKDKIANEIKILVSSLPFENISQFTDFILTQADLDREAQAGEEVFDQRV